MRVSQVALTTMIIAAAAAGCSSTAGTPVQPIFGGTPTPGALGSAGPFALCDIANDSLLGSFPSVPGIYTLIETEGNVVGTTYSPVPISATPSASPASIWEAISVTATASPTPSPTPTATSATPTPSPTPSEIFDVWLGTYDVPAFVAPAPTPSSGPTATPISVNATHSCMLFVRIVQPPSASGPGGNSINAEGIGFPFDPTSQSINTISLTGGFITTFTLTNLTSAGGSGSFVLDTGTDGTFNLGPQKVYTFAQLRRLESELRKSGALVSTWQI